MNTPKPNLWHRTSISMEDTSSHHVAVLRFMDSHEGEMLTTTKSLSINSHLLAVADAVAKACKGTIVTPMSNSIFVEGIVGDYPILTHVGRDGASSQYDDDDDEEDRVPQGTKLPEAEYLFRNRVGKIVLTATGHRAAITAVFKHIDGMFDNEQFAQVKWWYMGPHGVAKQSIYLPPLRTKLCPEFYPDLDGGPARFIQDYLAADESILLLAGPPGTGKTTLLRHMIVERKLSASICYDEVLMKNDQLFHSFVTGTDSDIMVIEDADTILTSRERDGNKLMARFLNVSDGLIKLPNKKMVFTTNLTDFGRVDPALLRPGRCYAVLHTRPLDLKESQEASKVGGFPTPTEKKQYTLAELFNQGKASNGVRKIGFRG